MTASGGYLPPTTIALGAVLILLGPAAYLASESRHWTALIPTFLGVVVVALGVLARSTDRRRTAAYAIGATGLLAALGSSRALPVIAALLTGGDVESPTAALAQGITLLIGLALAAASAKHLISTRAPP